MEIKRRDFPPIIKDNDELFIQCLYGVIESIDELCHIQVNYNPSSIHFRVAPSTPEYLEPILNEVLKYHNMFGIRLELGKSMKKSSTVIFNINTKSTNYGNRLQSGEKVYLGQ